MKTPANFVGNVIGDSESKTRKILESCRGKVLLIDEAYGLGKDTSFHRAVLDTLVAEVPPEGGGDLVVVLIGYEEEIDEMIRNGNPGLARRFSQKVRFSSYSSSELRQILKKRSQSQRLDMSFEVISAATAVLSRERKLRNFGNAGAAFNLLDNLRSAAEKRIDAAVAAGLMSPPNPSLPICITIEDINSIVNDPDPFQDMILSQELLKYVQELSNELKLAVALRKPPPSLKHVVFVGPAGTGNDS
jgi:chromosomal replication initiation ATPase DnaA